MAISTNSETSLGEYAGMGYHLEETGDHIVELLFKGSHVSYFSQLGLTPEIAQKSCRQDWARRMEVETY